MRWTEPHSRSSSSSKSLPRCRREVSVPRLEAGCRTPLPATTPKAPPPTPNDIKRATPPSPTSHSPIHHQCKRIPVSSFVHSEPDLLTSVTRSIRSVPVSPRSLKYTMQTPCHHPSWGGHRSSKNHVVLFPFPLPLPPSSPRLFLSGGAFAACLARCFYRNHAMPCHARSAYDVRTNTISEGRHPSPFHSNHHPIHPDTTAPAALFASPPSSSCRPNPSSSVSSPFTPAL